MLRARSFIAFLDRVGFGHVFTFFGSAIKPGAFPVVNVCLSIDPNEAMASAGCWSVTRNVRARASCGCGRSSRSTGWRRTFRFKQISELRLSR